MKELNDEGTGRESGSVAGTANVDREQVATVNIGASFFMLLPEFALGVNDMRCGRRPRFDLTGSMDQQWAYERGRQFALIAPASMPLRKKGRLNLEALALLVASVDRGDVR